MGHHVTVCKQIFCQELVLLYILVLKSPTFTHLQLCKMILFFINFVHS